MDFDMTYFQFWGAILIILGVILFITPLFLERVPFLEKVPWIILYVYRSNNFIFVTSPILIIISIIIYLINLIKIRV
jgi:hypothetical protein